VGPGLIPKPLAVAIAVVITGVWGLSQLAGVLSRLGIVAAGYEPPEAIHAALMIVLGAVFALRQSDKPSSTPPTPPTSAAPSPPPAAPLPPPSPVPRPTPLPPLVEPSPPSRTESAADMIARLRAEQQQQGGAGHE
jgi:hypothetical protein